MVLEKAWDLKGLVESLKAEGLDVTEDAAKLLVSKALEFVEESVKLTPNKMDDLSLVVIQAVKPFVMNQLDKIDGEEG